MREASNSLWASSTKGSVSTYGKPCLEKANSAEPADVAKALEGWETEDWPGKVWINPKTHQTVRDYFFLRCKKQDEMKHTHDYADIVAFSSRPLIPDEFNECKDIGSL